MMYKQSVVFNRGCLKVRVLCTIVTEAISKTLGDTYQRLYELPDPKLPVKYPRTPGYRPSAEENPYNAW